MQRVEDGRVIRRAHDGSDVPCDGTVDAVVVRCRHGVTVVGGVPVWRFRFRGTERRAGSTERITASVARCLRTVAVSEGLGDDRGEFAVRRHVTLVEQAGWDLGEFPSTLRLLVLARPMSAACASSASMKVRGTPWASRVASIQVGCVHDEQGDLRTVADPVSQVVSQRGGFPGRQRGFRGR